jgi:hypothetical protein
MGDLFRLVPTPLYTIDIYCTNNIVLVDCTNKNLLKKKSEIYRVFITLFFYKMFVEKYLVIP